MKISCECGWRGNDAELLRAADPFNPGEELVACPQCRDQADIAEACEHENCWKHSSCGGTFADGVYRRTCGEHADWLRHPKS